VSLVVLIDDIRSFRDSRPCLIARSSASGVQLLESLRDRRIEELWLDHDLVGEDTIWPVIRFLEESRLDIGIAHIQAARSGPANRMGISLRRVGYDVQRSTDLSLWVNRRTEALPSG
jgi:hypothetical protein